MMITRAVTATPTTIESHHVWPPRTAHAGGERRPGNGNDSARQGREAADTAAPDLPSLLA
jgi:hypothetical protein